MTLRLSILAIVLGASGIVSADPDPDSDFAKANQLFETGDYAAAQSAYESIVRAGNLSPDLYFNLGTACHRAGESGAGVLWMRRALVLAPSMAEVRQSLAFLQTRLGYLEFAESKPARLIAALPSGFGAWTVSLCVWFAAIAIAGGFFAPGLRGSRAGLLVLGVFLFLVAIAAHYVSRYRETRLAVENFATVTAPDAQALTAPAPDAKKVIDLPPGSEVRLLQRSDKWTYVEIPGDLRGWVRSDLIESNWPIPLKQTDEKSPALPETPRSSDSPLPASGKGGGA